MGLTIGPLLATAVPMAFEQVAEGTTMAGQAQSQNTAFREMLDRKETADLLGVSPRTLDRWHLLRVGPPRIVVGRQVRYKLSSVQRWLDEHEEGGPGPSL